MNNLLLDTDFRNVDSFWQFKNCNLKNNILTSDDKLFSIYQDITLPNTGKVYLRFKYKSLNPMKKLTLGIQIKDTLHINNIYPREGKEDIISTIIDCTQNNVRVYLIAESYVNENRLYIKEPTLINLNYIKEQYSVKQILDKIIYYTRGHSYVNELKTSSIDSWEIEGDCELKHTTKGFLITTNNELILKPKIEFNNDTKYLVKSLITNVNDFGDIGITNGITFGTSLKEQVYYLHMRGTQPYIKLNPRGGLPYTVLFKKGMVIDITNLHLQKTDLERLTFVKGKEE